jgi:hypothetical protein
MANFFLDWKKLKKLEKKQSRDRGSSQLGREVAGGWGGCKAVSVWRRRAVLLFSTERLR